MAEEVEQTGNLKHHFMWSLPLCSHALAFKCTVHVRPQLLAHVGQVLARPAPRGPAKFVDIYVDPWVCQTTAKTLHSPYQSQRLLNTLSRWGTYHVFLTGKSAKII